MHRFFIHSQDLDTEKGKAFLRENTAAHVKKVLRLREGDEILVSDGQGSAYVSVISCTGKDWVEANLKEALPGSREPKCKVVLAQSLIKGEKMDLVVQKCTELGVKKIFPMVTRRTVVNLTPQKASRKIERWSTIAREAAQQSHRDEVPFIGELSSLEDILAEKGEDTLCLFLWEQEEKGSLKEILKKSNSFKEFKELLIFIGPEGGFAPEEAELAEFHGAYPATLGPRILRTETAAIAALTMVLYELDDLGGYYE
ncbi:MAG: 16S rRNA (uracil(1498)-N(3))-methyltransferase [Candidatus Syntrophonatronum acetioxidans]|uniref:Ribosomal RNA small subunit methyltransferase E n=1 Tax=Candidatus Syntrophonatronum acetioxidans TaxID=1795816 RepID=A0A424YCP8_9FIRM|nr:MAG: 16S rRNA (uracil(1498)-N(3))-methyltransferase [Candidatus Syntrophonatronum acetioxidans]